MCVSRYVRPSIRPQSFFFRFHYEIWCADRGRLAMHNGMPCDPIQGQDQGH